MKLSATNGKQTGTKPTARSRVGTGKDLFPMADGRSVYARTMRDFMADCIVDRGGDASTAERAIIRRAATLQVELILLEERFATGGQAEPSDLDLYQRAANSQRRLLEAVGMARVARDVTPNLAEYIEAKAQ